MKKLASIIIIVGVVCSGIILIIDKYSSNIKIKENETIVEVATQLAKYDQEHHIGDLVSIGNYDITIHNAKDITSPNNTINPLPEGYKFYQIEASVKNYTNNPIEARALFATSLYVDDKLYDIAYNLPMLPQTLDKMIFPGQEVKGNLIFEIPIDAKSIELIYMSTVWDYRVVIQLEKPIAIEDKVS